MDWMDWFAGAGISHAWLTNKCAGVAYLMSWRISCSGMAFIMIVNFDADSVSHTQLRRRQLWRRFCFWQCVGVELQRVTQWTEGEERMKSATVITH